MSPSAHGDWAHPCIAPKQGLRIGCILFSRAPASCALLLKTVRQCMSKHLPHRANARLMSGQRAEDQSEALNLTGNFQMENRARRYTVRPLVNVPEREAFNVSTADLQWPMLTYIAFISMFLNKSHFITTDPVTLSSQAAKENEWMNDTTVMAFAESHSCYCCQVRNFISSWMLILLLFLEPCQRKTL